MFDISFWELCLVGIVALLVLGPEKLPRAARTAGHWIGKARRTVASMKAEIERDLDLEDLRQLAQHPESSSFSHLEKGANSSVSGASVEEGNPRYQLSDPPNKPDNPTQDPDPNAGPTTSER